MRFLKGIVLFFAVLVLFFVSCHSESPAIKKPANFIERDSMIAWTAESYIIEGEIFYAENQEDKKRISEALYADFFEKHHITEEIFKENTEYYLSGKEESQAFMEAVMQKIRDQRDEIQNQE